HASVCPRAASIAIAAVLLLAATRVLAQDQPAAAAAVDQELARETEVAYRVLAVLERNPRRGVALDKAYAFHVENGSLEDFLKRFRQRTETDPNDGAAWLLLGLIDAQRGRDTQAAEALAKAKDLRPTDPLAAFYLGQSLVALGQAEQAAAAFEE